MKGLMKISVLLILLLAASGMASAVTVIDSCGFNANTPSEYYVLGSNLTCGGSEHGIIIGADGVVIDGYNETDGKYYWIDGESPDCNDPFNILTGIYDNEGHDHVTIKNIEILHFCIGIHLTNAQYNDNYTIENCTIHDIGTSPVTQGITLKYISNSTIKECDIYNINGEGTSCESGGDGIFLFQGNNNTIIYNNFHHNRKSGMLIKMMPIYNNISYNKAWGNGWGSPDAGTTGGIILRCKLTDDNLIAYNNASDNIGNGIFIGGNRNIIEWNTANNNTQYGINIGRGDGSLDNILNSNTVCDNNDIDIRVISEVTGNHGDNNTCDITSNYDDNGTTGCTLFCSGTSIISDFSCEPTMGAEPLSVYFTDQSNAKQGIDSWSWDFDDDGIVDNTTQNPVYIYTTLYPYNYYNVSLTVNGTGGDSAIETKTDLVKVWKLKAAPNADFYCEPGVGDYSIPVTLTDMSIGEITSWSWDFDNDGIVDNTTQNPVYQYTANGIYNISLKVSGPGGLSTDAKFYCIRVGTQGAPKRPLIDAHFFADKRTGSAPFTVQFTDMSRSQGKIVLWKWDFGDGNTSNEQNPQHTYDSLGIYNVSLETTLNTGAVTNETKSDYITVSTAAPSPFVISGRVNCTNGDHVNDPGVMVTNLNSSEILPVETYAESNYYRIVVTSSDNVSAGNVLHFNVTGNSNPINFNHTITANEIEAGGFARNIAVDCGFTGICGDVTCNGVVDTGDVILLSNYVGYYPGMPQYALNSTQQWAGDVTGNDVIDTGDVILLSNYVGYSGYELNCT